MTWAEMRSGGELLATKPVPRVQSRPEPPHWQIGYINHVFRLTLTLDSQSKLCKESFLSRLAKISLEALPSRGATYVCTPIHVATVYLANSRGERTLHTVRENSP